jgi:hypothetical protein
VSSTPIQQAKLKLPLPLLMERLGLGEHAKKSAKCPFHEDKHSSFSIWQKDGAWFFKCHAGCGKGDEINFLEKHEGILQSEATKLYLEMAGCAWLAQTAWQKLNNEDSEPFDWSHSVGALTERHLERLGNERWYSREFCSWLRENKLVGLHNDCVAFPVHNEAGTVVGVHYCLEDRSWRYHPKGMRTAPLIIGDLASAKQVHVFESQWDMLAFMDRTDIYPSETVAFIATRGASNAQLVHGLLREGVSVCAWPQNDAAGEKWLSDFCAHAGTKVAKAVIPAPHKDMNEWTASGARCEDIYGALWRNELINGPQKPADLGTLLDEIHAFLQRFISFTSEAQPVVIALWVAHAWLIDAFQFTPYLHIVSPTKQCGKSRLLDCLELLVPKAWRAVSMSVAALFRTIEKEQPTLLMDEVDAVFSHGKDDGKEDLRSMLNAGFERGSKVRRCVGPNFDVKDFAVFCPKALAGIGKLPDTVSDRCIPIRLVRKKKSEAVQRFRKRDVNTERIVEALCQYAQKPDVVEALRKGRVEVDELRDRQNDICEPLIVIADIAGGHWPRLAREALVELCGGQVDEDGNLGVKLLADIRNIFERDHSTDRLPTKELLDGLIEVETDAPWAGWWEKEVRAGTINSPASKLARFLKPYQIKARVIKMPDATTSRGFLRGDFEDAWNRYLPPSPLCQLKTCNHVTLIS